MALEQEGVRDGEFSKIGKCPLPARKKAREAINDLRRGVLSLGIKSS